MSNDLLQGLGALFLVCSYIFFLFSCARSWTCPEKSELEDLINKLILDAMARDKADKEESHE